MFWDNYVKNVVWKNNRKRSRKRSHKEQGLRQRRGSAEGGEASPRSFASMCFAYCLARPATSERGAADDGKHAFKRDWS